MGKCTFVTQKLQSAGFFVFIFPQVEHCPLLAVGLQPSGCMTPTLKQLLGAAAIQNEELELYFIFLLFLPTLLAHAISA